MSSSLFVTFAFFFGISAQAIDLNQAIDPALLPTTYQLPFSFQKASDAKSLWNEKLLEKKDVALVEGSQGALVLDPKLELYALHDSRVVYIRRPIEDVAPVIDPLKAPFPPPIYDPRNFSNQATPKGERWTLFDFLYQQKVAIVTIRAHCQAAVHYTQGGAQIQTRVRNCFDSEDPQKLIFREAIQTTDLIAIDSQTTALLIRNFVVAKRNRFGLIKPSPEDMKNASIDMCQTTLKFVLNKLGVDYSFTPLFHPAM